MILRISAEITGGKSKHGRKNLLGLEADKLSARGVIKHWNSYTQPILDSSSALGLKPIGVCMDSHERALNRIGPKILLKSLKLVVAMTYVNGFLPW